MALTFILLCSIDLENSLHRTSFWPSIRLSAGRGRDGLQPARTNEVRLRGKLSEYLSFYFDLVTNFLQLIKGKSAWSFEAPWDRRRWRHCRPPHLLVQGQLRVLTCRLLCQRGVWQPRDEREPSTAPRHQPPDTAHPGRKTASDQVSHRLGWYANWRIDHGRKSEP